MSRPLDDRSAWWESPTQGAAGQLLSAQEVPGGGVSALTR